MDTDQQESRGEPAQEGEGAQCGYAARVTVMKSVPNVASAPSLK